MESVKILITGDFCPIGRSEKFIISNSPDDAFEDILPLIQKADLAITDLECPLVIKGRPISKTGPAIKSLIEVAAFLKISGFDLVTIANNHIMDYGIDGLTFTIEACNEASLEYIGAGNSLEQARRVYYYAIKGISFAFINICENEWSTTHDNAPGANPVNPITNYYDIEKAKKNADYVFVIMHGGNEMYDLPSPRFKELCHFYINAGAKFVICHHTHVFSGYEHYKNGMIFYGLGNFLYDHPRLRDHSWNNGIIIELTIDKEKFEFNVIPIRQSDSKPGTRLLPDHFHEKFEKKINTLNKTIIDDKLLQESFINFCLKETTYNTYYSFLQPYSNRIIKGLFKRGYLPSVISSQSKMLLANLIRCESHQDVLKIILNK